MDLYYNDTLVKKDLKNSKHVYYEMNIYLNKLPDYIREVYFDDHIMFDYGSHSSFFFLYGTKDELKKFRST